MYSVVIIDDELRIRRGIAHCMSWEDMGCVLKGMASNGVEALALIRSVRPDLVITDIRMPDMDGLDLISILRKEGIASLFIVISGYADFEYAQRVIRYGVSDYILKPIEEKKLYESIQNCLNTLRKKNSSEKHSVSSDTDGPQKNLIIRKTLHIIESEYMNNLSLSNISERVGVHPNYLSTLFTKNMGEPFGNYLAEFRMKIAKDLMDVTTLKVYEIAERVGYQDYRWFSKLFKQTYGITPMEYRSGMPVTTDNTKFQEIRD